MGVGSEGQVTNPATSNNPDSLALIPPLFGKQGEALVSPIHGAFFTAALRKNLFWFNVAGVTVPVVASNLVSVFTLWNPPSSGVVGELVDIDIGQVLAATVVNVAGLYFSSGSLALAGTFTTKAVAQTNYGSARIGDAPNNAIIPYSAYTHSGTPVLADIVGAFGATTNTSNQSLRKEYNGRLIIPPGTAVSVAMSTAAGTASGLAIGAHWAEWPFA